MKTVIGSILIILGVVSLFRYPNFGVSLPESIGVLTGVAIFVVPGVLLIKSDLKNSK
jgi:hypothetical protein